MADSSKDKTWVVVGASRGIGHEFVKQLLARGDNVVATTRKCSLEKAASLWPNEKRCEIYDCDMLDEPSIDVRLMSFQRRSMQS